MTASAAGASEKRTDSGRSSSLNRIGKPLASLRNQLARARSAAYFRGVRRLLVTLLALSLGCMVLSVTAGGAPPVARVAGPKSTADTTPTFRLSAKGKHGGFRCSVDGAAYRVCRSPWTPRLAVGAHVLRVRTVDTHGRAGRSTTLRVTIVAPVPGPKARKAVDAGSAPWGVLLAGDSLWVATFFDHDVRRLDPATGASRARIPLGGAGTSLAAADGQVWAANFDGNRVVRVDTGAVTSPIAVGPGPEDLVAGLGALWTANKGCDDPSNPCPGNGSVSRVDVATGSVKTIPLGKEPRYVSVGASSVWATSFFSDTVSRIDPVTGSVTSTVAGPKGPGGVAEAFGSVWVAGYENGEVWRLDPATLAVTAKITGVGPGIEDLKASGTAIWTANSAGGSISRIDPSTNKVTHTVNVGAGPRQIAPGDSYLWVSNLDAGTVQRVDYLA
jgi:YVTN family beta-propeller protein